MRSIIAIDPGVSGGIVYHDVYVTRTYAMPASNGDVCDLLRELKQESIQAHPQQNDTIVCYMEKVGGFAGAGHPGSAMFNFGRGVGYIEGCLYALGIPMITVRPQEWQSALHLGKKSKNESKTDWKNGLKAKAQELYPAEKVTLKTADALLICYHAIKEEKGK